jgi:nitrogen fixation protein FixH
VLAEYQSRWSYDHFMCFTAEATLHVLTKIFVVFASFLSVLLVALTVAYASNAGKIVSEVEGLRTQNRTLSQERAIDNASRDEALRMVEVEREALRSQVTTRTAEIIALRQEAANLRADLAEAEHDADVAESRLTQLAAANNTQAAVNERLTDEVSRRREEQLALERRSIELQDEINDLRSAYDVARSLNDKLIEQIAEMERGDAADAGTSTAPPVQVFGRVTRLNRLDSGDTYVEVDLGTSDQLRVGHELHVVRGSDYIGTILLRQVDVNAAVGVVTNLRSGYDIRVEDNVQSPVAR